MGPNGTSRLVIQVTLKITSRLIYNCFTMLCMRVAITCEKCSIYSVITIISHRTVFQLPLCWRCLPTTTRQALQNRYISKQCSACQYSVSFTTSFQATLIVTVEVVDVNDPPVFSEVDVEVAVTEVKYCILMCPYMVLSVTCCCYCWWWCCCCAL